MEDTCGFGPEGAHVGKGSVDEAIAFGDDGAIVCGNDPCVSSTVFVAAIRDKENSCIVDEMSHFILVADVDVPIDGVYDGFS